MRWISKYTQPVIEEGSSRLMRVFAFRPKDVNGTLVWLEHFEVLQVWKVERFKVLVEGQEKGFEVGKWVDISTRLMK